MLVHRRGRLVGKGELLAAVWPGVVVEENYLAVNVSKVRQALGDDPRRPRYVETVPRKGYRFVAPVEEVWPDTLAAPRPGDGVSGDGVSGDAAAAGGAPPSSEVSDPTPRARRAAPRSGWPLRPLLVAVALGGAALAGVVATGVPEGGGAPPAPAAATDADAGTADAGTAVPEAREAYLRARVYFNRRTGADLRRALAAYRAAVEADPDFAAAYAGMAEVYALLVWYAGVWPDETMPRARAAADRALALAPALPDALVVRGMVAWLYDRDGAAGERFLRAAVARAPGLPAAHQNLGLLLARMGREAEALAHLERARTLDPLSAVLAVDAASVFLYTGRYDEAIRRYRAVLDLEPGFMLGRVFLALAYDAAGRREQAVAEAEAAVAAGGRDPLWLAVLGRAYASAGREGEARAILAELGALPPERFVSPLALAVLHVGLGERGRALDELERAVAVNDPLVVYVAAHPLLRPLHGDPRFDAVVRRVGYPG